MKGRAALNARERPKITHQGELDRAYRARMAEVGIVRKSVLVPESRSQELKQICKAWRDEVLKDGEE